MKKRTTKTATLLNQTAEWMEKWAVEIRRANSGMQGPSYALVRREYHDLKRWAKGLRALRKRLLALNP